MLSKKIFYPSIILMIIFYSPQGVNAQWIEQPGDNPPARLRHTMVEIDGVFFVYGGKNADVAFDDVWVRQDENWRKEETTNSPRGRFGHTAHNINGKMTVFFGKQINGQLLSDIWEYDPNNKIWRQRNSNGTSPTARHGHASAYLPNENKVYVFGGETNQGRTNDLYSYDLSNDTWSQEESMEGNTFFEHRAFAKNDMMYVFGGVNQQNEANSNIYSYSSDAGWEMVMPNGDPPGPRWNYTMMAYDTEIHVVGGFSPSGIYDDHWVYDCADNTWSEFGSIFPLLNGGAAGAIFRETFRSQNNSGQTKSKILIFGGWSFENGYMNTTWVYSKECVDIVDSLEVSICEGESFDGYENEGRYEDTFTLLNGCDSLRVLDLSVLSNAHETIVAEICEGESIFGYTQPGIYEDMFTASNGCDSVRVLDLTILSPITDTLHSEVCSGDTLLGYYESGIYYDTLIALNGCDSIRVLDLSILQLISDTLMSEICYGDTLLGYYESGIYYDTLMANNGCDSVRVLELEMAPNIEVTDTIITSDSGMDNGSISITINDNNGGYSFLWSNGETTEDITNLTQGDYSVTVTGPFDCFEEFTFSVDINTSNDIIDANTRVDVFPNPTKDILKINIKAPAFYGNKLQMELFTPQGALVQSWPISQETTHYQLNVDEMESGLYILLISEEGFTFSKKVLITK